MSIAAPVRSFAAVRRPLGTCFASAASAFRPPAASTRPRAMAAAAAAVPAAKETPSAAGLHTLESLQFNNTFLSELPGDKSEARGVRQVRAAALLQSGRLRPACCAGLGKCTSSQRGEGEGWLACLLWWAGRLSCMASDPAQPVREGLVQPPPWCIVQVYGALWSYVAPTPTKGGEPRTLAAR